MQELESKICVLIDNSLSCNKFIDSIYFPLPQRAIIEINKILYRSKLKEYQCEINSHDIRHTYKGHKEDIHYICKIPEIVENFTKVKKSITKHYKTKKTIVSIEFYKKYDDTEVKLVKMDLIKDKKLRLKTIFVV
ncbi:MAG: hypothetical protein DRG78_05015 [Epsilonproteobacteria bacterium]|nr:MAG: hypothetical protein DRG78_05015 [Campylobacterota bacterium]